MKQVYKLGGGSGAGELESVERKRNWLIGGKQKKSREESK